MGAMKDEAMRVSEQMGLDGVVNDVVLDETRRQLEASSLALHSTAAVAIDDQTWKLATMSDARFLVLMQVDAKMVPEPGTVSMGWRTDDDGRRYRFVRVYQ